MDAMENDCGSEQVPAKHLLGGYGFDRRRVLAGAGVAVLVSGFETLGFPSEALAGTRAQVVAGPIREVGSAGVFRITALGPKASRITVRPARPLSEPELTYFSSLRHGDEIVAEGDWSGDHFAAVNVGPLYRDVQVKVVRRRGSQLVTTDDTIRITKQTRSVESYAGQPIDIDAIGTGAALAVEGVRDPATGELVATRISDTSRLT